MRARILRSTSASASGSCSAAQSGGRFPLNRAPDAADATLIAQWKRAFLAAGALATASSTA